MFLISPKTYIKRLERQLSFHFLIASDLTPQFVVNSWLRVVGNPVFVASHSEGGHFAAYEKPNELVGDLRKMYARGGPAYGVIQGKDGY